jgi:hypothetical protein
LAFSVEAAMGLTSAAAEVPGATMDGEDAAALAAAATGAAAVLSFPSSIGMRLDCYAFVIDGVHSIWRGLIFV